MLSFWPFILGIAALLVVPGPTNSLLAAAGARSGLASAPKLMLAEVSAYLIAITLLMRWGTPALAAFPAIGALLQLAVAAYLVRSAIWFWRQGGSLDTGRGDVTASRVFLTTLGNPKSVIFAFLIFPATPGPQAFGLFALINMAIALGWMCMGALIARQTASPVAPRLVYKGTAGVHVLFALLMARAAMMTFST